MTFPGLITCLTSVAIIPVALAVRAEPALRSPAPETCIFILATPGSGSSSILAALAKELSCDLSGENWGAFISLARYHEQIVAVEEQNRSDAHDEVAWHKLFDFSDVGQNLRNLVRAQLNPLGRACWGFKEVRYGRGDNMRTLDKDVAFLQSLCDNPKIVFHTTANVERELQSSVIKAGGSLEELSSRQQRACFDAYLSGRHRSNLLNESAE